VVFIYGCDMGGFQRSPWSLTKAKVKPQQLRAGVYNRGAGNRIIGNQHVHTIGKNTSDRQTTRVYLRKIVAETDG
jgi:hypothetical protein